MEKRLRFFAVQKHLGVFSELTSYERQQLLGKLRLCWHFVSGGRKNAKFWLAAAERGIASPRLDGEKWTQLEYSRIHQRRLWLPVAAELLGDWPTRLRDICRESGCTQRMLIDAAMPKEDSAWLSEIILGLKPSKRREARRRKQLKRKITHRSALSRVGLAAAIQLQFPGFESF